MMDFNKLNDTIKKRELETKIVFRCYFESDGMVYEHNSNRRFDTSSMIKLPIQLLVEDYVQQNKLRMNSMVGVLNEDWSVGSGSIARDPKYKNKNKFSVHELSKLNIQVSDCIAANVLLRTLGGRDLVNKKFNTRLNLKSTEMLMNKIEFEDNKLHQRVAFSTCADMAKMMRFIVNNGTYKKTMSLLNGSPRSYLAKALSVDSYLVCSKTGTNWWGRNPIKGVINETGFIPKLNLVFCFSAEGVMFNAPSVDMKLEEKLETTLKMLMNIIDINNNLC